MSLPFVDRNPIPIPPDGHLWLGPVHPRPLRLAQHHPDHQAAAVAQLVRVPVIVKQEDNAAVPGDAKAT